MPVIIDEVQVDPLPERRAEAEAPPAPRRPPAPDRFVLAALMRREAARATRLRAD